MTRILGSILALFILASAVPVHAGDGDEPTAKIEVSGWQYARERKTVTSSNRVTATFALKNTTDAAIRDINVTLTYATGLGETVIAPISQAVGTLNKGETRKLTMVGDFVPAFQSYTILVKYAGGKDEWYSNSDVGQPQYKNASPVEGTASVLVLGREGGTDRSGRFNGVIRVKNEGKLEAKGLKITVTFFDGKKKLHEWSGQLGTGKLAGGAEANIPFSFGPAPKMYTGYEMKVGHDDIPIEQALAGGEFTTGEGVEFAQFGFNRTNPKSPDLNVSAKVRNGFKEPVTQAKLTLVFFGAKKKQLKEFTYEVPGTLAPGEIKPISFTVPALPAYEAFEQRVDFVRSGGAPTASKASSTPAETPKFKNTSDVEVIVLQVETNEDKSVAIAGAMRNGKPVTIKNFVLSVTFLMPNGKTVPGEVTLAEPIHTDEQRNFVLTAPNAAGFSNYSYKFKFAEEKGAVAKPAEEKPAQDETKGALDGALRLAL